MGMFDLGTTAGLKDAGKVLSAGIHNATFKSLAFDHFTSQAGKEYDTLLLTLDVDGYGEWTHRFFNPAVRDGVEDPTSAQRTSSQYGENPSRIEHFMVSVRQIIDALDPEIGNKIDNDNIVINGKKVSTQGLNFTQLAKLLSILSEPYVNTKVEIKLVPQNTGFNDFPGFPARINRAGMLGIASRFIGHDLTISQSEQRKIDAAKNTKPTNMSQSTATLDGLADTLGVNENDDLPF